MKERIVWIVLLIASVGVNFWNVQQYWVRRSVQFRSIQVMQEQAQTIRAYEKIFMDTNDLWFQACENAAGTDPYRMQYCTRLAPIRDLAAKEGGPRR